MALPILKKQGGALIFINSVEGQRGLLFQASYASSKHAVKGLTDSLRIELKMEKAPVSVTNIYPSNIDTPLYDKVSGTLLFEDEVKNQIFSEIFRDIFIFKFPRSI